MIKYKIIISEKYKWNYFKNNNSSIFFKSSSNFVKDFFENNFGLPKLNLLKIFLNQYDGYNNFIYENEDYIICAVDRLNSESIFYYIKNSTLFFSNDLNELLKKNNFNFKIDELSQKEIQVLGYVLGEKTIFKGVNSLRAGEILIFDKKESSIKIDNYFNFFSIGTTIKNRADLIVDLKDIEDKVFDDLIQRNKDKTILLALSGGLDSRYVLKSLLERNVNNIITFSYGFKNNYDSLIAQKIAKKLDVKWKFYETSVESYKKIYSSSLREKYWDFASGGTLAPNLYFFEAIKNISEEFDVNKITIVNGQAGDYITGNHLPNLNILNYTQGETIAKEILSKHFQNNMKIIKDKNEVEKYKNKILHQLKIKKNEYYNYKEVAKYIYFWEWKERQTKRVVNMQKVYDFFNIQWELPLWNKKYIDFWLVQSYETKYKRNLFIQFLVETDKYNLFSYEVKELPKWLANNNYITIIGKIIKVLSFGTLDRYFYNFMNLFSKYGFMFSPYPFKRYFKRFNEYKDPLSYLGEDWLNECSRKLK